MKMLFKGSSIFSCNGHFVQQSRTILAILIEGHPGNIHVKSFQNLFTGLFVLRFYGPVNPMGSCRAQSVYLTTHLQGRLSPPSG